MLKKGVQEPHQCWSVRETMARMLTRTHGIRDAVHTDTWSKSDKTRCDKRKPKNLAWWCTIKPIMVIYMECIPFIP